MPTQAVFDRWRRVLAQGYPKHLVIAPSYATARLYYDWAELTPHNVELVYLPTWYPAGFDAAHTVLHWVDIPRIPPTIRIRLADEVHAQGFTLCSLQAANVMLDTTGELYDLVPSLYPRPGTTSATV